MAKPQLENGYIRIANEIFSNLRKIRIPGEAMQCLLFIIEKTYGFNKKEDRISNSQFVNNTGLKKSNVCRSINKLIEMNIVIKKDNTYISSYCFNKDYEKWKPLLKKKTLSKKITGVIKKDNKVLSKKINTKDNTKNNITKDNNKEWFELLWDIYPRKLGKKKAYLYFKDSVKKPQDFEDINKAIKNYIFEVRKTNIKYIQYGSTWFNNWRDWVNYYDEDLEREVIDEISTL